MKKEFALSAALHLALVALLFIPPALPDVKQVQGDTEEQQRQEKKGSDFVELIPISGGDTPAPCDKFYEGVGLIQGYENGQAVVTEVAEGYPAYRAGVRVGDKLLNGTELKGPAGTSVTASFSREIGPNRIGVLTVTMIRERICEKAVIGP